MGVDPSEIAAVDREALTTQQVLVNEVLATFTELVERFEADDELQAAFRRFHFATLAVAAMSDIKPGPTRVTFTYKTELVEEIESTDPANKSKPKPDVMQQIDSELETKGKPVEGGGPPPNPLPVDASSGSSGSPGSTSSSASTPQPHSQPVRETLEAEVEGSGGSVGNLIKSWVFKGKFKYNREPLPQVETK